MNIQSIPLSALRMSPHNARKTGGQNVSDLAASILAVGLLQNLTVARVAGEGGEHFEVIAGGRRLRALQDLHKRGALPEGLEEVPCQVITNGEVVEASTAENTIREAMHPADQFDAFKAMVDAGKAIVDVAAHFNVPELVVKQRLKLANVSPKIVAEYREGKASLAQLQTLALTDDHKAQEKAWFVKNSWERSEHELRQKLTQTEVSSDDPRVRTVGLDAYEARGGAVRRDLFDSRGRGYVADVALLDRMVKERLEQAAAQVAQEGWAWVETHARFDYSDQAKYGRTNAQPTSRKPTPEEQKRLLEIRERSKAIDAEVRSLEESDDDTEANTDSLMAEDEDLRAESDRIHEGLSAWPASVKQSAGVLVYVDNGGLVIERGRLKPGQRDSAGKPLAAGKAGATPGKPKKAELSDAMVHRLSAHRTAALQLKLAQSPDTALRVLVDHLVSSLFFSSTARRALSITPRNEAATFDLRIRAGEKEFDKAPARVALKAIVDSWQKRGLPTTVGALRAWVFKQDRNTLVELLALATAVTLDAEHGSNGKRPDADAIAEDIKLNMAEFWQPSPATFLALVPKALAIEAVAEACGKAEAATLETLKRDAVIAKAAEKLQGKGWLPKVLRGPSYKLNASAGAKPANSKVATKKAAAKKAAKAPARKAKARK